MKQHMDSALAVATQLERRDDVASVRYSGLASNPYYKQHRKYCPCGAGSILTFDPVSGREARAALIDALSLFSSLVSIGDIHSLVIRPVTTTRSQPDDAGLAAAGVSAGAVHLSMRIEHIGNILADLEHGLAAARVIEAGEPSAAAGT